MDAVYRQKLKARRIEKETPKRTTIKIEGKNAKGGALAGGIALIDSDNALQSGRANLKMKASGFGRSNVGFTLSEQVIWNATRIARRSSSTVVLL